MGMVGVFRLAPVELLQRLKQDPESIEPLLLEEDHEVEDEGAPDPGGTLDVDKAWHGLHFVLTGTAWEGEPPLNFILGGEELAADFGYGPPRVFMPPQLQAIATAIEPIDEAEVARRYSPARMKQLDIYPDIWDRPDENNLEYLQETWALLKPFLQKGAAEGFGLVVYLS